MGLGCLNAWGNVLGTSEHRHRPKTPFANAIHGLGEIVSQLPVLRPISFRNWESYEDHTLFALIQKGDFDGECIWGHVAEYHRSPQLRALNSG